MNTNIEISFVIPLYNEEENFAALVKRMNALIDSLACKTEVVLIDDGSTDKTPFLINNLALDNENYVGVFLSKNHGHQLALTAGLSVVRGTRAIMIIDGDLQDPPELIHDFLAEMNKGFDVVYGIRKQRKEGVIKRFLYWSYYRIMKSIAHIDLPLDSGDFALLSRKVVDYMNAMPEQNRYLRGMRTWIGFKQTGIVYERNARHAGVPKYSWKKLLELALSGIYNFSDIPVKVITRMGIAAISVALLYLVYTITEKIIYNNVPTGFTAIIFAIVMFSGVQLISLGIIGEYVLRIYKQSQSRPLFIIDKIIRNKQTQDGQELLH